MEIDLQEMGLGKYKELRPQQKEAMTRLMESPHRVDVAALPTGTGKSLLAMVYAKSVGMPTVILTSTKGLQDQYQADFDGTPGIMDLRGAVNYPCRDMAGLQMCDVGRCTDGDFCEWKESGCTYYDRLRKAPEAQIVVTNYSMWFSHRFRNTLGRRDIVVCDEAHELDAEIAKHAGMDFRKKDVEFEPGMEEWCQKEWQKWAHRKWQVALEALKNKFLDYPTKRRLRRLASNLGRLAMFDGPLIWDHIQDRLVRFEPLDLSPFVEPWLLRHAPKGLLMSATVKPYMVEGLGMEDFGFMETDSPFPVEHRPIYWVKGVRLNSNTSESEWWRWAEKIDEVIEGRRDRKGIVHTVSYQRARMLKDMSKYTMDMIIHDPSNARETVKRFKQAKAPAILVSPSVHTGYDFPYDEAAWQIIGKVPFPDTRSGIARARQELDGRWNVKFAVRTMVQMAGRVVRAEDDLGETIIVDDSFKWLYSRYKPMFPRWLRAAVQNKVETPAPWWKR
jgi:Rad3-related DNA helicase